MAKIGYVQSCSVIISLLYMADLPFCVVCVICISMYRHMCFFFLFILSYQFLVKINCIYICQFKNFSGGYTPGPPKGGKGTEGTGEVGKEGRGVKGQERRREGL